MSGENALLEIKGLRVHFETERGVLRALDGVDLSIGAGKIFGLAGESGCGKTVLALSTIGLLPMPLGRIVGGEIRFCGIDLLGLPEESLQKIRGREISMIFQEPMTSLNPVFHIGEQIAEVLRLHEGLGKQEALGRSVELLRMVGIGSPETRIWQYPHQLSGGMRQRVMIAMALACRPRLILADEPTTALDVTIQAQVIELMKSVQEETRTAILLITHDLGVIAEVAEDVAIMYAGWIVEQGPVEELFAMPLHPYTRGLLASIPYIDAPHGKDIFLKDIPGGVPALNELPTGCRFQDRCLERLPICREKEPLLQARGRRHQIRCWKYGS